MSVSSTSTSTALTGLSGYDFSGVINAMMQNYNLPETQMQTQESTLQAQQSAWQAINTSLSALNNTITALQSADTWNATTATSSNTGCLTATGGNGAIAGNYTVNVTNPAAAEVDLSATTNDAFYSEMGSNYTYNSSTNTSNWDFQINGKNVVIKSSSTTSPPTLTDICNSINNAQAGVTAAVIQVSSSNYAISITDNTTGSANTISYASTSYNSTSGLLSALKPTVVQSAKDAVFSVNGVSIDSASNTVTTAIPGVTLNLLAGGSSTVMVAADSSVAQKAVQAFVDAYNSTQDLIASDLNYDTKTKTAGVLFGDAQLEDIQSRLREMMGSTFLNPTSPDNILSTVGISTSSDNFGESADLTFNATTFAQAYAANPQSVANLFSASYNGVTPTDGTGGTAIQGLGNTLAAYLNPLIEYGGTLSEINTGYTNQITDIENQISDFQQRSTDYQNMLNAKFANLETLLSKLNSQGSWLTSQINSLSSNSSTSSSSSK